MTVLKYLLEFFFTNFWHFCGLIILLIVIIPWRGFTVYVKDKGKEDGHGEN